MTDSQSPKSVTSHTAVWWAETADGTRDEDLWLVEEKGKLVIKRATEAGGYTCILKFHTASELPGRPKPTVTVTSDKGHTDLGNCDAVFWTESAVEKFLWPYYHSHRIYDSDLDSCRRAFLKDPSIIAIGHVPPSHSIAITTLGLVVRKNENTVEVMDFNGYQAWSTNR